MDECPQHVVPAAGAEDAFVGASLAMREVKEYLPKVAASDCNVLITGETGTGKEYVANWLHRHSSRARHPLVSINCAAIPEGLLESELFGYERGAFTGAHNAYAGKLRLANGGTLFLDEIGDMSLSAQAKILRVIEAKEVSHLGSSRSLPINVRVVAATNQNLDTMMAGHRFRKDLYYRLDVAHVHLPPLRERREDIPLIFRYYLDSKNALSERAVGAPASDALECLLAYDWPGNVRELRNVIETIFISPPAGGISIKDLPQRLRAHLAAPGSDQAPERERLLAALFAVNWNKSKAAQALHWSRMTLYRKMAKYHIEHCDSAPPKRAGE